MQLKTRSKNVIAACAKREKTSKAKMTREKN